MDGGKPTIVGPLARFCLGRSRDWLATSKAFSARAFACALSVHISSGFADLSFSKHGG